MLLANVCVCIMVESLMSGSGRSVYISVGRFSNLVIHVMIVCSSASINAWRTSHVFTLRWQNYITSSGVHSSVFFARGYCTKLHYRVYVDTCVLLYTYIHTYMYICVCVSVCVCLPVCLSVHHSNVMNIPIVVNLYSHVFTLTCG